MKKLQRLLRHGALSTTEMYSDWGPDADQDTADLWDEIQRRRQQATLRPAQEQE
jgi:hypothetical protein